MQKIEQSGWLRKMTSNIIYLTSNKVYPYPTHSVAIPYPNPSHTQICCFSMATVWEERRNNETTVRQRNGYLNKN